MLWLWHRLAAIAPILLLVQELPDAAGAALKRKKKKKRILGRCGYTVPWLYATLGVVI